MRVSAALMRRIIRHGEERYPEEGAGLMLGHLHGGERSVTEIYPIENTFQEKERTRRYRIDAKALLEAELEAEKRGLDVIGIFHSHPDHPAQPSEFDRNWALPWFSYIITSVLEGKGEASRAWRLSEDRCYFNEETILILEEEHVKEIL